MRAAEAEPCIPNPSLLISLADAERREAKWFTRAQDKKPAWERGRNCYYRERDSPPQAAKPGYDPESSLKDIFRRAEAIQTL